VKKKHLNGNTEESQMNKS